MKIYINNRGIEIFRGATVLDGVRSYSGHSAKRLETGSLMIVDRFGNKTEPDGELTEGQKLFLKRKSHESRV